MQICSWRKYVWYAAGLICLSIAAVAGQRTYKHVVGDEVRKRPGKENYRSPDHALQATVIYFKPRSYGQAESKVEIHTASGKLLASTDYSSSDGTQGGTINGAAWTADSRFFVYQRESSGGHSAWHYSISFYSQRRARIYSLDGALDRILGSHGSDAGDGAITGDLELVKPSTLITRGRVNVNVPGVRTHVLKHPDDGSLSENSLTIDLVRLESVLTSADVDATRR